MSLPDATGPLSLPTHNLRETLCDVPAFQQWCGVGSAAEARQHIHLLALPTPANAEAHTLSELQALRPYALIATENGGMTFTARGMGSAHDFDVSGILILQLECDVPLQYASNDAFAVRWFENHVGAIVRGLANLFGSGGYFAGDTITVTQPPTRRLPDDAVEYGDSIMTVLTITYSGSP